MQHKRTDRGPSAARSRQLQRPGDRPRDRAPGALASAAIALSLTLMGCSNLMQTGGGAAPQGRLTVEVADAALAAGAPDVALRVAELILRDAPHNVPALVAKGDANYAMGHLDLARGAYSSAVSLDPASVPALIGLGRTLVRSNPKAAEAAFLDAATRAPDNATALSNLGIARDLQGRHEAAQTAYRQALAVAPGATDVTINLGLSLALSGKPGEAVALLHPLVQDADATAARRNDLAAALALAGDRIESQRLLRGNPQPGDADAAPADIASAAPPLAAITAPIRGHAAQPADTSLRADLAPQAASTPHADATPGTDSTPSADATRHANLAQSADLAPPADQPRPTGLPLPTDVSPHADATPSTAPATHNGVVLPAGLPLRADATSHMEVTPYATVESPPAAGPVLPLDIRTAPVMPVMQVADANAMAQPVRPAPITPRIQMAYAEAAPQAVQPMSVPQPMQLTTAAQPAQPMTAAPTPPRAPHEVTALSRPHDRGPVKLAAVRVGKPPVPPQHSMVAVASRTPVRSFTDAPTEAAPQAASAAVTIAPATATPAALTPTPSPTAPSATAPAEHKAELSAQLAALDSEQLARAEWQHLQTRLCGLLDGRTPEIMSADVHGRTFWRLRTGGFHTATEQSAFCTRVRGLGSDCW